MQRLAAVGWGRRRIARELGCSPETVRKYLRQGGWQPYGKPSRNSLLDGQRAWLKERFLAHRGNAAVALWIGGVPQACECDRPQRRHR